MKYGIGQPANIHFTIPNAAVETTDVKFLIRTNNLEPVKDAPNSSWLTPTDGGYYFTVPKKFQLDKHGTLYFQTKRIASAETVTISTADESQALFIPASASFGNEPITGTLQLSDGSNLSESSFIVLERKNGTRVGDLVVKSVQNGIATYRLTLRSEYDFTMDEQLTIYYASPTNRSDIYQAVTTFNDLVDHPVGSQVPLITLVKQ